MTYISLLVFCLALLNVNTLKGWMVQLAEHSGSKEHFILRWTFGGLVGKRLIVKRFSVFLEHLSRRQIGL